MEGVKLRSETSGGSKQYLGKRKRKTTKIGTTPTTMALCYRCEHRARAKEEGRTPRYECGQEYAVECCYMYAPVKPLVVKRIAGDRRVAFGPGMISARVRAVAVAPGVYTLHKLRNGLAVYYQRE